MVKNYMETLVQTALFKELDENPEKYPGMCRCSACIATAMAFALNNLKPFYITCIAGEVYGQYHGKEIQNLSDILVAVINGVHATIKLNPHNIPQPA